MRAFGNVHARASSLFFFLFVLVCRAQDFASNGIYPGFGEPLGLVQATQGEVGLKELVMGTHSRSGNQWDIWEAVFSPVNPATGYVTCRFAIL